MWDLSQDAGVLTYPEGVGELFSDASRRAVWDKLSQQSGKSRECGWDTVIRLGFVFPCMLLFLFPVC